MAFVRPNSNSVPAVVNAFFKAPVTNAPERRGGAENIGSVPYFGSPDGDQIQHSGAGLMINGVRLDFSSVMHNAGRSAEGKAADARQLIETALRTAGIGIPLASALSRLLCDADFAGADGIALNQALDGAFRFGEPSLRELNVMVDHDGVSVHRRSSWDSCVEGQPPDTTRRGVPDLLCIDSGVRFYAGKDKVGNIKVFARPDYWVHATSPEPQGDGIAEKLASRPAGSTGWDRFVDVLAWLFGAVGISFETAENLGKDQARLMHLSRGQGAADSRGSLAGRAKRLVAMDAGNAEVSDLRPGLSAIATPEKLDVSMRAFYETQKASVAHGESGSGHGEAAQARAHQERHAALTEMPVLLMQREGKGDEALLLQRVAKAHGNAAFGPLFSDSVVGLIMGMMQDSHFGEALAGTDEASRNQIAAAEKAFVDLCRQVAQTPGQTLDGLYQRIARAMMAAELVVSQLERMGTPNERKYIANAPQALRTVSRIARLALDDGIFAKVKVPRIRDLGEMVALRDAQPSFAPAKILSQTDNAGLLLLCGLSYSDVDDYFRRE